jgi:hypothetical protein
MSPTHSDADFTMLSIVVDIGKAGKHFRSGAKIPYNGVEVEVSYLHHGSSHCYANCTFTGPGI